MISIRDIAWYSWGPAPTRYCGAPPHPLLVRQFDVERRPAARLAVDPNPACVIGHDRLHNGEAKARTVLLGRVIRSKQPFAFLVGQARAGVAHVESKAALEPSGADGQLAARRHRVDRIDEQVLQGALQLIRIGTNRS